MIIRYHAQKPIDFQAGYNFLFMIADSHIKFHIMSILCLYYGHLMYLY